MGKREVDGSWHDDCLDRLNHGEPHFVLRAQDLFAPILVRLWAALASLHGLSTERQLNALEVADEMEKWEPKKFPD